MSLSLRDQLLKAGLVTEKQVQDAERHGQRKNYQGQKQQNREQRAAPSQKDIEAQKAREAKAARDAELNRKQQEKAHQKQMHAQVRELVEQNKVIRPADVEESFSFVYKGKVSRVRADAALRARITSGDLVIVRCDGRFELVPPAIGAKIKERDARALVDLSASSTATETVDEAYKDFVVPDDLMW